MEALREPEYSDVEFALHCRTMLPDFLEKAKEKGIVSAWKMWENADCITVNVKTSEKNALINAWKNRSRGGYREGAGRKKLPQGVKHLWVIPQDIHELAERYGTAWLWEAVRFKVKFDNFGK